MSTTPSILDTLDSHLRGLREQGVTRVAWKSPMPRRVSDPETSKVPRPRQQVAPSRTVPKAPESPALPSPPVDPVVKKTPPAEASLRIVQLDRLSACGDEGDASDSRIALILETGELEGLNRSLLGDMLKAIGYGLPDEAETWNPDSGPLEGGVARVLVMGNTALQSVSTAGMDLQIVRGMWQQSPHGKLLSTFPPSYLHDNPPGKKAAWGDLQKLLVDLGLSLPAWTRKKSKKS